MPKRVGALMLAASLFAGCYSSPPSFWHDACQTETGERHYETPPPDGLAVPDHIREIDALILSRAAWIEYNAGDYFGDLAKVYGEGAGRYAIRLSKLADPLCQAALRLEGYDPASLAWVGRIKGAPDPTIYGALAACVEGKRLGDRAATSDNDGRALSRDDVLKQWTAPYIALRVSGVDSRSPDDVPVSRFSGQIVHRETGKVIAENIGFMYMPKTAWFPRVVGCGAPGWSTWGQFPEKIFQADQ